MGKSHLTCFAVCFLRGWFLLLAHLPLLLFSAPPPTCLASVLNVPFGCLFSQFPNTLHQPHPLPLWHVLQAFVAGAKLNIPAPLVLKVFALKTFCIFFLPPFFSLLSAGRGQHNVACNSGNFVFKHGQLCLFWFALFAGHTTTLSLVSWSWGGVGERIRG